MQMQIFMVTSLVEKGTVIALIKKTSLEKYSMQ